MKRIETTNPTNVKAMQVNKEAQRAGVLPYREMVSDELIGYGTITVNIGTNPPIAPITYSNLNVIAQINQEIILPDAIEDYIDFDKINQLDFKQASIDLETVIASIISLKNLDEAVEILKFCVNSKLPLNNIKELILKLCQYYPKNKLLANDYLKQFFRLTILKEGKAKFSLESDGHSTVHTFPYNKKDRNQSYEYDYSVNNEIRVFSCAVKNGNYDMVNKIYHFISKNFANYLNKTKNNNLHTKTLSNLVSLIELMKPEYQNQFIAKYGQYFEKNIDVASKVSITLMENGKLEMARDFLEGALQNFDNQSGSVTSLGYCQHNLALTFHDLDDDANSFKYCKLAYENLPNDPEVLHQYLVSAVNSGKVSLFKSIVEKLPNSNLKTLLSYIIDLRKTVDFKALFTISENSIPKIFRASLYLAKLNATQSLLREKNIVTSSASFKTSVDQYLKKGYDKEYIIPITVVFGYYDLARDILSEFSADKIASNKLLRGYDAILNEKDDNLIERINNYEITESEKGELHNKVTSSILADADGDKEKAQIHIEHALKADPQNKDLIESALITSIVSNNIDKIKEYKNLLGEEEVIEISNLFNKDEPTIEGTDETPVNVGDAISQTNKWDPKKIHQHYQLIKAQNLASSSHSFIHSKGWSVSDKVNIDKTDATYLGKFMGIEYYGYIDDNLKIGESLPSLSMALEKGFTSRDYGQNGVKCLGGGKAFELKTDSDLRLFTDTVYINEIGKALIYFNRSGNHKSAAEFAKTHKLQYVKS